MPPVTLYSWKTLSDGVLGSFLVQNPQQEVLRIEHGASGFQKAYLCCKSSSQLTGSVVILPVHVVHEDNLPTLTAPD